VYKAKDIKTAEAAKVIENIQRDLNIALMNELTIIFHKMGLDTKAVLEAASTKWNFESTFYNISLSSRTFSALVVNSFTSIFLSVKI